MQHRPREEIKPEHGVVPAAAPTVAVLLPNYNHARFIGRALRALVEQTKQPDEILVIDDASTDDSIAVIESFAGDLPQLRVLRNRTNMGVNDVLNRGLDEARSSHVLCSAADDWVEQDFVARMSTAVAAHPEGAVCVSSYVQYVEAEDRRIPHDRDSELGPWYTTDDCPRYFAPDEFRRLLKRGFVWLPQNAALLERKALKAIKGYDGRLRWHADWFAVYALAFRRGFTIVPEPLSVFRVAPESYSGSGMRDPKQQRQVCAAICDKLREPEFADIREAMRQHPAVLSTFFRPLVEVLATRPREWPLLGSLARWWLKEMAHGRRPRVLRDLTAKFGNRPFSTKLQA
jgi:glycosyltransferase involved in cell wall biosynthesis